MERKIGEIFEYDGEWYQCVKGNNGYCRGCAFYEKECKAKRIDIGSCSIFRKDCTKVIFKKLEKVGEPYKALNRLFQVYKVFTDITDVGNYDVAMIPHYETIDIELKQTKEEMEENYKAEDTPLTRLVGRYVNNLIDYETFEKAVKELYSDKKDSKLTLKEFDLEAAKAGKPVCTRDGRKARIICFDRINGDYYKIVACVTAFDGDFEEVLFYGIDGYIVDSQNPKDEDLMMLPEKKEGWVNVYKDGLLGTRAYNTEKEAFDTASPCDYVDTVKISWEE